MITAGVFGTEAILLIRWGINESELLSSASGQTIKNEISEAAQLVRLT
ncbi:hypothetical protein [Thalassotalea ganghwensis]